MTENPPLLFYGQFFFFPQGLVVPIDHMYNVDAAFSGTMIMCNIRQVVFGTKHMTSPHDNLACVDKDMKQIVCFGYVTVWSHNMISINDKTNLRDLKAATGLVILLKLDSNFLLAHMTLKSNGWIRKTIGHLFYAMSKFVHYFKAISKFNLELNIGNILSRVTLKFDGWSWKTIGHLFYITSSFVHI